MHSLQSELLHLDLKPDNILVNINRVLKVCDFGIAKSSDLSKELLSSGGCRPKGTTFYMAPEILFASGPATVKSDVWSMGCTLFEIQLEKHPGQLASCWTMSDDLRDLIRSVKKPSFEDLPVLLTDIYDLMFEFDPANRCKASEVLQAFNEFYLIQGETSGLIKNSQSSSDY